MLERSHSFNPGIIYDRPAPLSSAFQAADIVFWTIEKNFIFMAIMLALAVGELSLRSNEAEARLQCRLKTGDPIRAWSSGAKTEGEIQQERGEGSNLTA